METKKNEIQKQLNTFMLGLITCHSCGSFEVLTTFEKVPTELKIHWARMLRNSLFLYCKHCDSWDVVNPREKGF